MTPPGELDAAALTPGSLGAGAPARTGGPAAGRLGRARPWLVPAAAALLTLLLAAVGAGTSGRLANGGYFASGTESARADRLLADRFGAGAPDLVLLVRAEGGVDSERAREEGLRLTRRLADSAGVASVRSYWTGEDAQLRAEDGTAALVTADLAGADRDAARTAETLVPRLTGGHGALTVSATGPAWVSVEAKRYSGADLVRAELVAAPLTLLLLVLALRSLVAALVPLLIGAVSVVGTIAVLRLLTYAMPVSVFAMNLTSALGFGLAVDYGLFLVTRYREELRDGRPVEAAVRRTARRAGRTVLVSACAVALSMSALLVLPLSFLRSMACAGMAVALFSAAAATVLVPPVLALLGTRIDRWDPLRALRRGRAAGPPRPDSPFWRRVARTVTRRPLWFGLACAAVLLLMASPFAHVRFGLSDDRVLPAGSEAHRTADAIRAGFAAPADRTLAIVLPDVDPARDAAALWAYERDVSDQRSVRSVGWARSGAGAGSGKGAVLLVAGAREPYTRGAQDLVRTLRALPGPPGEHLVTGRAALLADTKDAVRARLPLAAGIAAAATWLMLFVLTGSVVLPLKALLIGALSLGTSFGVLVFGFQDEHLRPVVGDFTSTGTVEMTMPLLLFAIAFGLAIDYEIFLLSRVREHYLLTGDNRGAVVEGVARTGRLVTTGALAVAVVTGALVTSGVTQLKLLGTGLATAVLVDAVLVRGVLVPAYLTVAGRLNWWAPGWVARLHGRLRARLVSERGR
ncbi:MMPL family transporter [Streptomyces abikoensis]|uniref:MMPL family transporter n=1 Tax=Streptomyces abikoensis TaxID=97398 RepID=UPI0036A204A7